MRYLIVGLTLALGACSGSAPPPSILPLENGPIECRTASATISFDFEGASASRCAIEGERSFRILVTPEHAPPINPSPWYAFRYKASPGANLAVQLDYLGSKHRYAPVWSDGGPWRALGASVADDGASATLSLPPGEAIVSAQEILGSAHYSRALARWADRTGETPFVIGRSHEGRAIEALRIGNPQAARLVVLLGHQHPPEVTGALAMEAFVDRITELVAEDAVLAAGYQFLIVPSLNPDGVARGHWRANLGGRDLNRDWGEFTQPETRAVKEWLDALPAGVQPTLMLDFHSTNRNLFYVQGEEASPAQERFLAAWLGGKEAAFRDYPFTIERRNANPGSGTTKNWFHGTYGIPAYTYEVADDVDRAAARKAAEALADALPQALAAMGRGIGAAD